MLHNKPFERAAWMSDEGAVSGQDAAVRNAAHYRSLKYRVSRHVGEFTSEYLFPLAKPIAYILGAWYVSMLGLFLLICWLAFWVSLSLEGKALLFTVVVVSAIFIFWICGS